MSADSNQKPWLPGVSGSADPDRPASTSATCWCRDGWLCSRHSDRPWPHDDCAGPGEPCLRTDCPKGRVNLRTAMAQWRIDAGRATGAERTELGRQIARAEIRLRLWERAHQDD
jgi:hypothetical protein